MNTLQKMLLLSSISLTVAVPSSGLAQSTLDVIDSFPKHVLEARAERRKAAIAIKTPLIPDDVQPTEDIASGTSPMGIDMVLINPGVGILGSSVEEEKRQRFENPRRDTKIDYPFEVSKYEITFDDWEKCLNDGGCAGHKPDDKGWGRGKRPVINISYDDAKNFISWLNRKTGKSYRLLSEAEWEYVARAGQDAPFGNGFDISAKQANFDGKAPYGGAEKGPYLRKTEIVGKYEPNDFGVYDMHGNVYEWVEDCWNENHDGAIGDGSARKDGDCKFRIMKGGSWVTHGYQMRAAARVRYVTDYRYDDYGMRLARTLN